jgi:hypothetical protein
MTADPPVRATDTAWAQLALPKSEPATAIASTAIADAVMTLAGRGGYSPFSVRMMFVEYARPATPPSDGDPGS